MSFFNEISGLFTTEITNSPQYTLGIKIKNLLIQDIQFPNINYTFIYQLQPEDYIDINNKDKEDNILILALKLILGVNVEIINNQVIVIMKDFIL